MKSTTQYLLMCFPLIWLGMVLGISFVEAPLKFQAPNITLALGLGIGRLVFNALNKIEWLCLILTSVGFLSAIKYKNILLIFIIILLIILLFQTFYLLPKLDTRAIAIIDGASVAKSSLHLIYVIIEIFKVLLLIVFSIFSFKEIKYEARY
ncbi:MAG: hypothetical protein H6553_12335 [Chitinophagales bacterium]|nr:hypothetical protein [Chitinophagales bacterium]